MPTASASRAFSRFMLVVAGIALACIFTACAILSFGFLYETSYRFVALFLLFILLSNLLARLARAYIEL